MTVPSADRCQELVARACGLLQTSGDPQAASVLACMKLQLDSPERWSLSGREVQAYRAVLLAPVHLLPKLHADAQLRERIRSALATVLEGPGRALRDLAVVLDDEDEQSVQDHGAAEGGHPYREGHVAAMPHPVWLRSAAHGYATAAGWPRAAEVLSRASLWGEASQADWDRVCTARVCVMLGLGDLAAVLGDAGLKDELVRAVRIVGQGPQRVVGDVTFAPDRAGPVEGVCAPLPHAAALLQSLLAAEGIACVVVQSDRRSARLLVSARGQVGIVDVGDEPSMESTVPVLHVKIDQESSDCSEAARAIRRAIFRTGG
jgi:hypothetical protein